MKIETTYIAEDGTRFVEDRAGCKRHDFQNAVRDIMHSAGYRGGYAPAVIADIMDDPGEWLKLRELLENYSRFLTEQRIINRS
jgi:hypothetical protein